MKTFADAIRNSFHCGFARDFCQEVSFLCAHDLCKGNYGLSGPRDTFSDGIKLEKKRKKDENQVSPSSICTRSQIPDSRLMKDDSLFTSTKSSSTHCAFGKSTADFMVVSAKSRSPLIMFDATHNGTRLAKD